MPPTTAGNVAHFEDVVAIGASAGGVQVLRQLAEALPAEFPAAVLVVLHVGANRSILPELLRDAGPNPAMHPTDGQVVRSGTIYVAPPDQHMLLVDGCIRLNREAKQNFARPAIDPTFRSIAVEAGPRAIGVVLSGRLDDGTAGLQDIKACGGLAIVQDPDDCEEPGMPNSACENVDTDYIVPADGLAGLLARLVGTRAGRALAVPRAVHRELQLNLGVVNGMEILDEIGTRSHYSCPECHGVLWTIDDSHPPRFRCHTGHAYSLLSMESSQRAAADEAVWAAVRALQERQQLLMDMAQLRTDRGDYTGAGVLQADAERVARHRDKLQAMLKADAA